MKSVKQPHSILMVIILGCSTFFARAQDQNSTDKMVGFGCGFAGQPTIAVVRISKLIEEESYVKISSLLVSKNEAEKYLAVICLERLAQLGKYQISEIEKGLIAKARSSSKIVPVCSGCTYFDKVSLKKMLADDSFIGSKFWLEGLLGKK
jgi:hypothetical protein